MKIKTKLLSVSCFVAILVGTIYFAPSVFAGSNTCAWTGAGDGINFSDASNWQGCAGSVPTNGDSLNFDDTSNSIAFLELTNDLTNLSLHSITFAGVSAAYNNHYTISGNTISLSAGITMSGDEDATFLTPIVLTGNQTFDLTSENYPWLTFGDGATDPDFNVNGYTLNIIENSETNIITGDIFFYDNITGSGTINADNKRGDNTAIYIYNPITFTGQLNILEGRAVISDAGCFPAGGTTVAAGAQLDVVGFNGANVSAPISVSGQGTDGGAISNFLIPGSQSDVTFSNITLTGNTQVDVEQGSTMTFTNLTSNGYGLTQNPDWIFGQQGTLVGGISASSSQAFSTPLYTTFSASRIAPNQSLTVQPAQFIINDGVLGTTTVENGGALKGTGTTADTTIEVGGTIAPGDDPSCLTITGNLTISGTYSSEMQNPGQLACTDYDQLKVTTSGKTINITNGTLDINLLSGYNPSVGQSFDIINNQTGKPIVGTFSGLTEGAVFQFGNTKFQITYKGGTSGNDVVITVVNPNTPTTTSAGTVPKVPNTGFKLTRVPAAIPLLSSVAAAVCLVIISRKIKPAQSSRH